MATLSKVGFVRMTNFWFKVIRVFCHVQYVTTMLLPDYHLLRIFKHKRLLTSFSSKASSDAGKNSVLQSEVNRKLLEVAKHILENAENVGNQFAKEARKIHRKEAEERSIYGTVTTEESKELRDEGIEIFSIPVGVVKKKPKSIQ